MGRARKHAACDNCGTLFSSRQSLFTHKKNRVCRHRQPFPGVAAGGGGIGSRTAAAKLPCPHCDQRFSRRDNLLTHVKRAHGGPRNRVFLCGLCPQYFHTKGGVQMHRMVEHNDALRGGQDQFRRLATAHRRACEVYRLVMPRRIRQTKDAFTFGLPRVRELLGRLLVEKRNARIGLTVTMRFAKSNGLMGGNPDDDDGGDDAHGVEGVDVLTVPMSSKFQTMRYMGERELEQVAQMVSDIDHTLDAFVRNGSGWVVADVLSLDVQAMQCLSLAGSCTSHSAEHARKRGLTIKHADEGEAGMNGQRCFFRAVARALLHDDGIDDPSEQQLEEYVHARICENVPTPVRVADIEQFERGNAHLDAAINVMYQDDHASDDVYPVRASPNIGARHRVNLLLFHTRAAPTPAEEEEQQPPPPQQQSRPPAAVLHYAWIRRIGDVLGRGKKSKSGYHYKHSKEMCYNCFLQFHSWEALSTHVAWCHTKAGQIKVLPQEGATLRYEKRHCEILFPWCFVFDFECLQVRPEAGCSCKPEELASCAHKSTVLTEQRPFAYGLVMVDRYGKICEQIRYVGEDAAEHFFDTVLRLEKKYAQKLEDGFKKLVVTDAVEKAFAEATECYMCEAPFHNDAVMDHDHLTGEYLGAAHNRCNLLRAEVKGRLCGFAHNFSGYDSHCVMKAIADKKKREKVLMFDGKPVRLQAVPLNTQRFKILKINNVTLMDSMSFLNDGLDKLVDNLKQSNHPFPLTRQWIADEQQLDLLMRKGCYPYDYMTHMGRLEETRLPPPAAFASPLTGSTTASEADYAHAQRVWDTFGCRNLRDYSELYVMADCYQLLEAIVELRNTLFEEFRLDLCHFFSLPMMAKEMLLKKTGVEVELLTDPEMIRMVKENIRGGLSYVNQRHFDVEEESARRGEPVSICYVDAVNLYGYAMSRPLPIRNFRWLSLEEMQDFDALRDVSDESDTGYIVECTLDYPEEFHADHNSFPLAPHRQTITGDMLSEYAREALSVQKRKGAQYRAEKLTSSFLRREKYVCHGTNLKLYLELGMRLVAVHRVIAFDQEAFIAPYIKFCSEMRAKSKTKTRSNTFKYAANSLFGKMIENTDNRMDTVFVQDREAALRRNTDPRLRGQMILNEGMTIAFLAKKSVKLDQLWPVGFTILEVSKARMIDLFYNKIRPAFRGKASVLVSDTDSFMLGLSSPSADAAVTALRDVMDTSNYDRGHPLFDESRRNQVGLLKNESPARDIVECVAVRSKVYAYRTAADFDSRCKGVKKSVRKAIPFQEFKDTVLADRPRLVSVTQHLIQSKNHVNRLMRVSKTAMTSFDDKRSLAICGIHSFPYGSKLIELSRERGACFYCENPKLFA